MLVTVTAQDITYSCLELNFFALNQMVKFRLQ